jgi:hypothetical protein
MQSDLWQETSQLNSTAILVLGMHRSGTSAATRILNILGAHLGTDLLTPQADNKKGFWEHVDAIAIHERLLSALGRNWHDVREMPAGWMEHPAAREAVDEIVELIKRDMQGMRLWAVKDPRMCRLAPLWIEALERLRVRTTALIVVREPYEVARSLNSRDNWTHAHAYLMWAQHFLESLSASARVRRSILSYDELMGDWYGSFVRIERDLGVIWSKPLDKARVEIEDFISPDERHHRASQNESVGAQSDPVPKVLAQMYEACKEIERGNRDWSALDAYSDLYRTVAPLFSGVVGELSVDRTEFERLAIERLNVINVMNGELVKSAEINDALYADNVKLHEENEALQAGASRLEADNHKLSEESAKLRASIRELLTEESELQGEMEGQAEHIAELEAERTDLEKALTRYLLRYSDVRTLVNSRRWLLRRLIKLTFRPKRAADKA